MPTSDNIMQDEEYDYRDNNVAVHKDDETLPGKRTNNGFALTDLPSDEELYDDEERQEVEAERRKELEAQAEEDAKEEMVTDDPEALLAAINDDNEHYSQSVYKRNMAALFTEFQYDDVPPIPIDYRGATIIGLRTRATGNSSIQIGTIAPKKKLRMIWQNLTPVEQYIIMLVSDHRHMTADQLSTFVILPTLVRHLPSGGHNSIKPYFVWLTQSKYGVQLSYKETHKTSTMNGLMQKIDHLVALGLIEEIRPSYKVRKNDSVLFNETPSLYTSHYYLTALGARVLICNTLATRPETKGNHGVGFVETYRNAAYMSIVHETECTDVFCSIVRNAMFLSNIDLLKGREDGDDKDYGYVDICRFFHEKDCEEKYVPFHDSTDNKDRTIDFKTDGELTLYSSKLGEFIDYFLEYDSGSSTSSKIKHKAEAFVRYILWQKGLHDFRFREPVLLLVSQNPAAYMPGLRDDKPTRYTRGIEAMTRTCFPEHMNDINDIATILEADCRMLRMHGALGACWHKLDLVSGVPERQGYDLLTASNNAIRNR